MADKIAVSDSLPLHINGILDFFAARHGAKAIKLRDFIINLKLRMEIAERTAKKAVDKNLHEEERIDSANRRVALAESQVQNLDRELTAARREIAELKSKG